VGIVGVNSGSPSCININGLPAALKFRGWKQCKVMRGASDEVEKEGTTSRGRVVAAGWGEAGDKCRSMNRSGHLAKEGIGGGGCPGPSSTVQYRQFRCSAKLPPDESAAGKLTAVPICAWKCVMRKRELESSGVRSSSEGAWFFLLC